jgi:2-polyprenyl-3-methyl-5-hydroxy-6-metoxy-1,4-benzoquinol methylase
MSSQSDSAIDPGRAIDWSRTSADYARHRQGPPDSFFARFQALGVGLPGQRILDLGTGTGLIARRLARQGSNVAGIDIAAGQLAQARRLAEVEGLSIDFREAPAEEPPSPTAASMQSRPTSAGFISTRRGCCRVCAGYWRRAG